MNVIYRRRQTGKTSELIERCSKDKYSLIVAPNKHMCAAIFKQSKELGCSIPYPITFTEFIAGRFQGKQINNFYIDELEMCLNSISKGIHIDTIVISKNDEL